MERFLERDLLAEGNPHLIWILDEVDGIFACDFRDEIFALFRSWYNARALNPEGVWQRLTLVISFATEAHLFIRDLNQSPFNVGTRFTLSDFNQEQVHVLGERYGVSLSAEDSQRILKLLGGHPYLTHRAFAALATGESDLDSLEALAWRDDETLFSGHLRRISGGILKDPILLQEMIKLLAGKPETIEMDSFYRLRSAGILTGDSVAKAQCRCVLYENYMRRRMIAPTSTVVTRVPE